MLIVCAGIEFVWTLFTHMNNVNAHVVHKTTRGRSMHKQQICILLTYHCAFIVCLFSLIYAKYRSASYGLGIAQGVRHWTGRNLGRGLGVREGVGVQAVTGSTRGSVSLFSYFCDRSSRQTAQMLAACNQLLFN
jgi:hypothetical protein